VNAARILAVAVRALPPHRREWGQAMLAELAAIDDGRARRRYARGCLRAVLTNPGVIHTAAAPVFLIALVVTTLALAAAFDSTGVRVETFLWTATVGFLAWGGRRAGVLGPVGTGRVARGVRGSGYLLVAAVQLLFMTRGGGTHDDPSGWFIAELVIALYLAACLVLTRGRAGDSWYLRVIVVTSVAGVAAWWVPMLLSSTVRAHAVVALWLIPVAVMAALATTWRRGPVQILYAALGTAVATCLLVFVAAVGTYALAPRLVPDIAGTSTLGGLTAADRAETNQVESTDPYVAELLLAGLFSLAVVACGIRLGRVPRAGSPSSAAAPVR